MLTRIADIRIQSYANWTVKFELMDANLLNSLARILKSKKQLGESEKAEVSKRFGQLYSYTIQRFIIGVNTLEDSQKSQLKFVLADVEVNSISKLLGRGQDHIKGLVSNVKQRSLELLEKEHDSLLGSASREGRLGVNYGTGGKSVTAPKSLSAPMIKEL
jgi:hypothetical protein